MTNAEAAADWDDDEFELDPDELDDPADWDERLMPDPLDEADHEVAKAYDEYWDHCREVHGGADCDCGPTLRERAAALRTRVSRWRRGRAWRRTVRNADEPPF